MLNEKAKTFSDLEVKQVYNIDDLRPGSGLEKPGEYPFTRGIHEGMYRERLWITRELCGLGTAAQTNERLRFLVEEGQTGLAMVPDTPSQMGLDSDHPLSLPNAGLQGVPLCNIGDMRDLCSGIDLENVTASFSVPGILAPVLVAMYYAAAKEKGIDPGKLRGSVQNDPIQAILTGYVAKDPLEIVLRLAVDTIEFCSKEMPLWHSVTVNAYDLRETGLNAYQEMGFALAIAATYVEETMKRGLDVDSFARRILIVSGCHTDFFEEIAKFRAARRVWAKILKEDFGAKDEKTMKLKLAVHTSGSSHTAQQPINNVVRGSYEALAAVLGGAQGLDLSSFDEGFCIPSEEAAMVSLRTQQILALETGVPKIVDPLGGSYYVEWLTDRMEEKITEVIEEVRKQGGILASVRSGWIAEQITRASNAYQSKLDQGEIKVVGVNCYKIKPEHDNLLKISDSHGEPCAEQIELTRTFKNSREMSAIQDILQDLYTLTKEENTNLLPLIIKAISAGATLQEILGSIRVAYGYPYDILGGQKAPFEYK